MIEIHSAAKPGRPRLLILLSAALLVGMLGLAWTQVYQATALDKRQPVGHTPLTVRLPAKWRADQKDPGRFILPVKLDTRPGQQVVYERSISINYETLPSFHTPAQLLDLMQLDKLGQIKGQPTPAKIGDFGGVQVHLVQLQRRRRALIQVSEKLIRLACLPRGELITIVYDPLVDLRPADFEIMDQVCESVEINLPAYQESPEDVQSRAGLSWPVPPTQRVVGPQLEGVRGAYVSGDSDGVPQWSLGLYRTWLAPGRKPEDLLRDFAAEVWLQWDTEAWIERSTRADGAAVVRLRHPDPSPLDKALSVWVIAKGPDQAAVAVLETDPGHLDPALVPVRALLAALEFTAQPEAPDLERATRAGRDLIAALQRTGPVVRWGRQPYSATYERVGSTERVTVERAPVAGDPEHGYEGSFVRHTHGRETSRTEWFVDARGVAYHWQQALKYDELELSISERRRPGETSATQVLRVADRAAREVTPQRWTFSPGDLHVPPPLESCLEGWVARGEAAEALYEVSSRFGGGTHTVLLRQLPIDGAYPRVLVLDDFYPAGIIVAFDDDLGEPVYQESTVHRYRRIETGS
jgi:hypothetical protein